MKSERASKIRLALESHVQSRLSLALKKYEGKEDAQSKKEREKAIAEYNLNNIIFEGAKCADQVQIATHIAKVTHPDLRVKDVTNIRVHLPSMVSRPEIGTHVLDKNALSIDATGNGAINKKGYELHLLLNVPIEDERFVDLILRWDTDALLALDEDLTVAKEIASKVVLIEEDKCRNLSSHTMAKQIYWCIAREPTDDAGFHLLQPLFSSSLAHAVHQEINDARFGDQNKEARQAFYKKEAHDAIYREYKDLAIRKLGGTKPQNISQLNSERRGENYLLGSLPPHWKQSRTASFFFIDSALIRFQNFENVRGLIKQLIAFLQANPDPTMETRQTREALERSLGQSLAAFGLATRHSFEPGWTRNSDCQLPLCEKIWLDLERADLPVHPEYEKEDQQFRETKEWNDWPDEIASRFANWLNAQLINAGVPVGDAEYKHWAKQAIVDADWPVTVRRRAVQQQEITHG